MQLKLWNLLRSYDSATDESAKQDILNKLTRDYLHFNFDHQKPQLREGLKTEHDESSQDEDESRSTLNTAAVLDFSNEKLIKDQTEIMEVDLKQIMLIKNDVERKQKVKARKVQFLTNLMSQGDGVWHELDFSKYDAVAVLEAASSSSHVMATL